MRTREVPSYVTRALYATVQATREWREAPTDHDHEIRHRAAAVYDVKRRALDYAMDQWVNELAREVDDDPPPRDITDAPPISPQVG